MKKSFSTLFLAVLFGFSLNAQFNFIEGRAPFVNDKSKGLDNSVLRSSTLLVEAFEATGSGCDNKGILYEMNGEPVPFNTYCPADKMTKADKRKVAKWDAKLPKHLEQQEAILKAYTGKYKIIGQQELESDSYADTEQYRFVLRNYYVSTTDMNMQNYVAIRYVLIDRKEKKEYRVIKNVSNVMDNKKVSNLAKVVKNLNE